MQEELDAMGLARPVQIVGVNDIGFSSGNGSITNGRDLPWLQANATYDVWDVWNPVYRDVIVLGPDNVEVGVFNVTGNSLSDPANSDALKQLFIDAASL
jgi:hypothetical protein